MAKFILRSELITPLTNRKIIDSVSGLMKMRIPHRLNRLTGEKFFEVEFDPSTHALQTSNEFTISVLQKRCSPRIWVDGDWFIDNPSTPWFNQVDDSDPMPGVVIDTGGTETLSRKKRNYIGRYSRETGTPGPSDNAKTTLDPYLTAADNYFKTKDEPYRP